MNDKAQYNCFVCWIAVLILLVISGIYWASGDVESSKQMALLTLFFAGIPVVIWLSWKIDP